MDEQQARALAELLVTEDQLRATAEQNEDGTWCVAVAGLLFANYGEWIQFIELSSQQITDNDDTQEGE